MTKVALIGNFVVPWCTEVHLARALRENGCEVAEYPQDNAFKVGPTALVDAWLGVGASKGWEDHSSGRPDLVMYVRTHNQTALGHAWTDAWTRLAHAGVKTAAFHLDRFFDLSREHLVWEHDPLFTMQHTFTADGGNDDRFTAATVNHHWLPPAVDREEASVLGDRHSRYEFDVVFAGSGGSRYHGEYPQRGELVAHLRSVYGGRFAHFGHDGDFPVVRGAELNSLYATAKVIVGDSCFANQRLPRDRYDNEPGDFGRVLAEHDASVKSDRYWSDRIPETLGRGGFLLHPWVPGVRESYTGSELATYNPGDWDDLDAQIGAYLANPGEREGMIERGRARVLREHTYTHRMRELLDTVGLPVVLTDEDLPV